MLFSVNLFQDKTPRFLVLYIDRQRTKRKVSFSLNFLFTKENCKENRFAADKTKGG